MNVGILYPRSKAHPGIMLDFMDGVKTFIGQQTGNDITIFSESIGFGGSEKEVYEKAEKLLVLEGVDVLVAYIGEKVIDILAPLVQANGKLLLVVHPGANFPSSWMPQANIIHLTLQDSFLCWLNGKEAGKPGQADAVVASTFYDCGYLHLAVMVDGFTGNDGKIVFNYINQQLYDDRFHINELESFLKEAPAVPRLLCLFDELPASLFYDRLNNYDKAAELDLFVSPTMLQPAALVNAGTGFKFSVTGYSSWQASVKTDASTAFYKAYHAKTNREPNLFSILGWEVGLILERVSHAGSTGYTDGAVIVKALQDIKFHGPRGKMMLDPQTNHFMIPFVQCSIAKNSGTMNAMPVDFPMDAWSAYIQQPTDGAGSGWTNTYLCY